LVFVISPGSINSKVCREKIDHAVKHNRRLVPIVHRECFEMPLAFRHETRFLALEEVQAHSFGVQKDSGLDQSWHNPIHVLGTFPMCI
jgi:hypothetical protein